MASVLGDKESEGGIRDDPRGLGLAAGVGRSILSGTCGRSFR